MLVWPHLAEAAEKKAKKRPLNYSSALAETTTAVTDVTLGDVFKTGQEDFKKGRIDEALRAFQAVRTYTEENLQFMKCAGDAYDKALGDQNLSQSQREDLFLKKQRITTLSSRYGRIRGESAYFMGAAYAKRGDTAQARKYLLEACRTLPFSLDQASPWMKAKALFLSLSILDGEF